MMIRRGVLGIINGFVLVDPDIQLKTVAQIIVRGVQNIYLMLYIMIYMATQRRDILLDIKDG